MSTMLSTNCPYKGLQPYTEEDRKYFFGRERDKEVVATNLYVTPLTVLYGGSGVGKSSVLQAGVIPKLRAKARTVIVYFNEWQSDTFERALKQRVLAAVYEVKGLTPEAALGKVRAALDEAYEEGERARPAPAGALAVEDFTLDDLLLGCARGLHLRVLLIFDQFEEYFLYHTPGTSAEGFDAEFARAVNQHDDGVNFMISMREEELSKLDRFRVRIPNLLTNLLRLEKLDREAAAEAITRPLEVYNQEHPEAKKSIEPALVEAILNQVAPESLGDGAAGQQPAAGQPNGHGAVRIETPFLQVVLTRLWEEERRQNSDTLHLKTLDDLGGAKNIARTHLDEVMSKLQEGERDTAASVLRFLVTPAGAKIAQQPTALAAWADLDTDAVRNVLTHLSSRQEMCILRKVTVPGQEERYELFHDVLGPAILNWQSRYTQQRRLARQRAEAEERIRKERQRFRRLAVVMAGLVLMLVGMGALTAYALQQKREADRQKAAVESQRSEVETQKNRALEQEQIAKNALGAVAQERDRANDEKTKAETQKIEAERQKTEAEKQKKLADEAKAEADRQADHARERAAAAELASRKVETEVFKGSALGDLIDGRVKEALDKFTELDLRYEKLHDPAGRAYANLKLADIHRDESYIDLILVDPSSNPTMAGVREDEDEETASANYMKQYVRLMLSSSARKKDEKDMYREAVAGAGRAAESYGRALTFIQASNSPGRARQSAEILSKLADTRLGLFVAKSKGDPREKSDPSQEKPGPPDKAAAAARQLEEAKELVGLLPLYEKARAAYAEAGMPLEEAEMYRKKGSIILAHALTVGKREDAEKLFGPGGPEEKYAEELRRQLYESYEKAAETYGRAQQPLKAAHMHTELGELYLVFAADDPGAKKSVAHYERAREIYKANRAAVREGDVTEKLASIYLKLDPSPARALGYYKQAHAAYVRSRAGEGSEATVGREQKSLKEIGQILAEAEGGKAALRQYVESELPAAGADAASRAWASAKLGEFYVEKDDREEALWFYAHEREVWRKAGALREEGDTLLKLGKLQLEAGAAPDALRSLAEARKVYAAIDAAPPAPSDGTYRSELSGSLLEIASLYLQQNDLRAAAETYSEALSWHLAKPARHNMITSTLRSMGAALFGLKSAEAEREYVRLSEDVVGRLGAMNNFSMQGQALSEIADLYLRRQERAPEAVKFYERALASYLRAGEFGFVSNVFRNLGEAKIKAGESEQAVVAYLEAAAASTSGDHVLALRGSALEALGDFYRRKKDLQKALDSYQKARAVYREAKLSQAEINTVRSMAFVYQDKGDKAAAEKLWKEVSELTAKLP